MFPVRLEGVVFDLDATLVNMGGYVNWREAHSKATKTYIQCNCSEGMIQEFSAKGLFNMLNLVRDENLIHMPLNRVEIIQKEVYNAIEECEKKSVNLCELMPGSYSTLEWLNENCIKMGIATSNSERVAKRILEKKGIKHFFSSVIGRRPELKMKPNPDQLLKCLEEMGIKSENSIMVGDSIKDVKAAKSANIYVVIIPSIFSKIDSIKKAGVDIIINGLDELPKIIPEAALVKVLH